MPSPLPYDTFGREIPQGHLLPLLQPLGNHLWLPRHVAVVLGADDVIRVKSVVGGAGGLPLSRHPVGCARDALSLAGVLGGQGTGQWSRVISD